MLPKTFEDFPGNSKESGTQINFQTCPVCGDQRFKVYVDPDNGKWFCFAHDSGGCVEVGMKREGWAARLMDQVTRRHGVDKAIDWPEISMPVWEPLSTKAERYLARRGIDIATARQLGIVEMEDSLRVILPYFGPTGQIIYWSARAYSEFEDGPKYMGASGRHPLYVLPGWNQTDELVVVEGAFDAIAVHQRTGLHVAALGGKTLPKYLRPELLGLVKRKITMLLDSDALASALKIRTWLPRRLEVSIVPLPDGEDPASLGPAIEGYLT